jgi:chromosome segregation ATPase
MDERKNKIRALEARKYSDVHARNRLLEDLGEALFRRIGDGEPFDGNVAETPGGVLAEYRKFQGEINEALDTIRSLEKEILRLKELEEVISAKELEKSRMEEELGEIYTRIGKTLFDDPDFHDATGVARRQEESLLARIEELDMKIRELERREGGIFVVLGRNAQLAMTRSLLSKNQSSLSKFYRETGEKYFSEKPLLPVDNSEKVPELRQLLSALTEDLSVLKEERRRMKDQFGLEGSPSRRIQGREKYISGMKEKFPALYLNMGSLAAREKPLFSSFLANEDEPVLEKAGTFASDIAGEELEIKKLNTAIEIDNEKTEIEKLRKAIKVQEQKILTAQETIAGLEGQIADTERDVEEMKKFIDENGGIQEDYGSEN